MHWFDETVYEVNNPRYALITNSSWRTLEIAFPSLKIAKFPGGACPHTPLASRACGVRVPPHLYYPCYGTGVSEIVHVRNFFIHELELKNDRGAVEMSVVRSYFLSLAFMTKCFTKNLLLRKLNLS